MTERFAGLAALVVGLALVVHAGLAFSKMRPVTALIELVAAAVLLWHWWLRWRAETEPPKHSP